MGKGRGGGVERNACPGFTVRYIILWVVPIGSLTSVSKLRAMLVGERCQIEESNNAIQKAKKTVFILQLT